MEFRPLSEDGKSGAEALRDGTRAGRILAKLGEAPSRGRHAWIGVDDVSLVEGESPELAADLYAAAGARWVDEGYLTHIVLVPAGSPLVETFFGLGFGQEQVHASAPARTEPPAEPDGVTIRQAGPDDLELVLDLAGTISEHQAGPPVWSGLAVPAREELRDDWAELLAEDGTVVLLAERDGEPVGYAAFYPEREGVAQLPVAGTRPHVRGAGIGVALAEAVLHRAHLAGLPVVETDWRSTNLLSSRFWPRRGFVPTHLRLRRDVQPNAS